MLDRLATEGRNPASDDLDRLGPLELVRLINAEDAKVAAAVAAEDARIARLIEGVADRMRRGGRLIYVGAGTSGRLGVLDAAECPPTFNTRPEQVVGVIAGGAAALTRAIEGAEDSPERGAADLAALDLRDSDCVVGVATSGRTPYVLGALAFARSRGALTAGISCNPDSELEPLCDMRVCPIVGPEVVSGSTRMKAGTATKLVLNTLTTSVMVLLGKTYKNWMVDLRATNSKLVARSRRIVSGITGLAPDAAEELLALCGGEVKTAIVAALRSSGPDEARSRLDAVSGRLRDALEE
ncbi:MAG: N-acetylmuramic acid 6-phosphate etherase [Planctomycetes bacterium]|nr:N-acetylmuramic acid 6-phosphate etherase [Planctomycetota bacterium]